MHITFVLSGRVRDNEFFTGSPIRHRVPETEEGAERQKEIFEQREKFGEGTVGYDDTRRFVNLPKYEPKPKY